MILMSKCLISIGYSMLNSTVLIINAELLLAVRMNVMFHWSGNFDNDSVYSFHHFVTSLLLNGVFLILPSRQLRRFNLFMKESIQV